METKAYQLPHGKCKKRASFEEAKTWKKDKTHIYEVKEDGIRYFLQIRPNGANKNYLTSRHVSKKTGRFTEETRIPQVTNWKFPMHWHDTILDGEWVSGKMSSDAQSGKAKGEGYFVVWDVIRLNGSDLRLHPLKFRWQTLLSLAQNLPPWMRLIYNTDDPQKILRSVDENGWEGVVRKDITQPYGQGWTKVKREITEDCIIWGYEETKSEDWMSKGWIGAIKFGQWLRRKHLATLLLDKNDHPKPGNCMNFNGESYVFVDCGKCSGMTQSIREKISKNKVKYLGEIIEVKAQMRLKTGKFRHPEFKRFRNDKNPWECVWAD